MDEAASALPLPPPSSSLASLEPSRSSSLLRQRLDQLLTDGLNAKNHGRTRRGEERVTLYLQLNQLLVEQDDTEASLQIWTDFLPDLWQTLLQDIQLTSFEDLICVCLRTISYFLFHEFFVSQMTTAQIHSALTSVLKVFFETSNGSVYKLCVWVFTKQNVTCSSSHCDTTKQPQHDELSASLTSSSTSCCCCLERILEAMVQAIVNPFKSREIEIQALQGLHELLIKSPEQVLHYDMANIWILPTASRMASRDASTRAQVLSIFQEIVGQLSSSLLDSMQTVNAPTDKTTFELFHQVVSSCFLQVMQSNLSAKQRPKETIQLWSFSLQLCSSSLANDIQLLNDILFIPELLMRHQDTSVRLLCMEKWIGLVKVFQHSAAAQEKQQPAATSESTPSRQDQCCSMGSSEWLFQKQMVQVLMQPIVVCLKEENLLTVLQMAVNCWEEILVHAVDAFQSFCQQEEQWIAENSSRHWKHWYDEMIGQVVKCLVAEESAIVAGTTDEAEPQKPNRTHHPKVQIQIVEILERNWVKLLPPLEQPCNNGSCHAQAVALAFLLPDTMKTITQVASFTANKALNESTDAPKWLSALERFVQHQWKHICCRIGAGLRDTCENADDLITNTETQSTSASPSLRLFKRFVRLSRVGLDFVFQLEQGDNGDFVFPWRWQVVFLSDLLVRLPEEAIYRVLYHPKTSFLAKVQSRVNQSLGRFPEVGPLWEDLTGPASDGKSHLVVQNRAWWVLMYLLLLMDPPSESDREDMFSALQQLVVFLLRPCEQLPDTQSRKEIESMGLTKWKQLGEALRSCSHLRSAGEVLDRALKSHSETQRHSVKSRSAESQENASMLLQLHDDQPEHKNSAESTCQAVTNGNDVYGSSVGSGSASSDRSCSSPCVLSYQDLAAANGNGNPDAGDKQMASAKTSIDEVLDGSTKVLMQKNQSTTKEKIVAQRPIASPKPLTNETLLSPQRSNQKTRLSPSHESPANRSTSSTVNQNAGDAIFPELNSSTEPISQLFRHFPLAFRKLFAFYKIKTIGDLSSMSQDQVKTFGIKDPVSTVVKALSEFHGRKQRMKEIVSSPYKSRQRLSSSAASPSRSSVVLSSPSINTAVGAGAAISVASSPNVASPYRKRSNAIVANSLESCLASPPSSSTSPHRKRARRSLAELNSMPFFQSSDARSSPKIAERVKFQLPTPEGQTRIARPGEDSQDVSAMVVTSASATTTANTTASTDPKDTAVDRNTATAPSKLLQVHEKMMGFTNKLLQHLNRCAYYVDRMATEEESVASCSGSEDFHHQQDSGQLLDQTEEMGLLLEDLHQAHHVITRMSQKLQQVAETSAKRCQQVIDAKQTTPRG